MAQLRHEYEAFQARDAEVIVLGPDDAAAFRAYWAENDLPFVGLPDPQYQVLKRYGQEIRLFKMGRMPAQLIVDKQGVARFVHYGKSMTDIPESADMLSILDELQTEAQSYA